MKQKTLTIIFGMILLIGIVTAAGTATGTIENFNLSIAIPPFIAGSSTSTTFSFNYPDVENNYNDAPIVVRVNISSLEAEYPVWKGDFQLGMVAKQYLFGGLFDDLIPYNTIPMQCNENAPINFHPKDGIGWLYTIDEIPNGTYYCYNPNYYMLQLDSHDDLTLSISSDPALYPGNYSVSVELMEMEPDNQGPVITLIEPSGENIFSKKNEVVPIKLNITDMYNIDDLSVKYKIVSLNTPSDGEGIDANYYDSKWIYEITYNQTSGFYEADFDMAEYGLNESGSYWIYAEAKDILGNEGKL